MGGKQKTKSDTVKNNLNPEWNFKEIFEIDPHSPQELLVEVFDEDIGKDDFLGKVTIDLKHILHNRLSESTWVALESCTSGEVLLSAEFVPASIPVSSTPISGRVRSTLESSMREIEVEKNLCQWIEALNLLHSFQKLLKQMPSEKKNLLKLTQKNKHHQKGCNRNPFLVERSI